MRILAVDDDETILELLAEALAVSGYEDVTTASSGEQALQILTDIDTQFDCFLLDIQMPGMDGVALCSKIREIPNYRKSPIVMVTAMSQKSYIDRAFSAGATDYITKPFDFLEVGTRLNLAKKLVHEQSKASVRGAEVADLKKELSDSPSYSLCEPIELQGIDHVVGYVAFDNYVLQLSRSHLFMSAVFAVKIAGIETIYAKLTPNEFRKILTEVARAIVDCSSDFGSMISYRGNGVFLCMNARANKVAFSRLEEKLMEKAKPIIAHCATMLGGQEIELVLSEQVSAGLLARTGTLSYLRRAIDSAETKAAELGELNGEPEDCPISEARDARQLEERKHGYEAFLRESLQEGPGLLELRQQ